LLCTLRRGRHLPRRNTRYQPDATPYLGRIEVAISHEEASELERLVRSRTEPASRVERVRMLLAYRERPSFYAVGRAIGVTHQTVERCLRRADKLGVMVALGYLPSCYLHRNMLF
jgi:hypothetical protein